MVMQEYVNRARLDWRVLSLCVFLSIVHLTVADQATAIGREAGWQTYQYIDGLANNQVMTAIQVDGQMYGDSGRLEGVLAGNVERFRRSDGRRSDTGCHRLLQRKT